MKSVVHNLFARGLFVCVLALVVMAPIEEGSG